LTPGKSSEYLLLLGFCVLVYLAPSFTVLGGDVSSVRADQAHINASLHVTQTQNYTIHELRSHSGVVREYASLGGKVFAVAWQSPALPDLKQLLGSHFEEFQQAAAQAQGPRASLGPLIIQHPGLVVELGGHMSAFVGRAYLPNQLPYYVRLEEIR
jgi:Protein of unknown function (DUF2844)